MNILVCSILRDNEPHMANFINQINQFVDDFAGEHSFTISLYENDSSDNTAQILQTMDLSRFKDSSVITESLGKTKFGSVVAEERVKNLAIARNKALTAKAFYMDADYVLFIDCDVKYNRNFIPTLISFQSYGIPTIDVYSGISVTKTNPGENPEMQVKLPANPDGYPKEEGIYRVYDTWGTRRTEHEEWGSWFGNVNEVPIANCWATYNSICLYNATPFKNGIRFDHINPRIGKFDLEVAVVCEKFREQGYNNIIINQKLMCFHD